VRASPPQIPPGLSVSISWRELWRSGAFIQNTLLAQSGFSSAAEERLGPLGMRPEWLERFDKAGALQPIAFVAGGDPPAVTDFTPYEDRMAFREEHDFAPWSTYAWEAWGHPEITAEYSPWQLLYAEDVARRTSESVPLSDLLASPEDLATRLKPVRGLLEHLQASWATLHDAWMPLVKLLVRVQNRYLPEVTWRSTYVYDVDRKAQVEPWELELESFDAAEVAGELGVSHDEILHAYWFLVERGIDREPRDGMEQLRRAQPRSAYKDWRGMARSAQDHYQAAQMLRRFIDDLTGSPPGRPDDWVMDGRQPFRGALFDHGPVPSLTREDLTRELVAAGLYPHAAHVIGEGKCEKDFVTTIVAGFLGSSAAKEIGFTDLGGSGSASRLPTMVSGLTTYATRTVVIVDNEGKTADYTDGLIRRGALNADDVCRFTRNIEESNFSDQELIDVLCAFATNPPAGREAVTLTITLEQLEEAYQERRRRSKAGDDPGKAGVLLEMAEDPEHGGPVRVSKREFACALAKRMLEEFAASGGDGAARDQLYKERPLFPFVLERVAQAVHDTRR
jgi:hypothetical protein